MGSKKITKKLYTAGDIVVNTANVWADLTTVIDMSLSDVRVGDVVEVGLSGQWSTEAVNSFLDVVSVVGGVPVNSWAETFSGEINAPPVDAHNGLLGWSGITGVLSRVVGSIPKTINAGDLSKGTLLIRLRAKTTTAVDKTLLANTNNALLLWAVNLGQ